MKGLIRTRRLGLTALLVVGLSGCAIGPQVLRSNRPAYNRAVQQSVSEELLLNIVRSRYAEPVHFLQLGSIVASFSVGAGLSGSATVPIHEPDFANGPNILNFGTNLNFAESPTLTFTPLEGEAFVTHMLTEASIDTVLKLLRSGWLFGTVMRIMASRIGPLSAQFGSPNSEKFMELLNLWSYVQALGGLTFVQVAGPHSPVMEVAPNQVSPALYLAVERQGYRLLPTRDGKLQLTQPGDSTLVMQLTYPSTAEADRVDALLGFKAARMAAPDGGVITRIALTNALEPSSALYDESVTEVKIVLRSFFDQLFYISQAIELPASDDSRVLTLRDEVSLKDVLHIRVSDTRPDDAFLTVRHRGHWFFISDQDVSSKNAFQLLMVIFALQSAGGGAGPNLTLPIGR